MSVDISAITSQFTVSMILIPVLQVISVLAAIVAVLSAISFVYALIRGDDGLKSDVGRVRSMRDDHQFGRRYERESRNARYAAWKKNKGF